MRITAVTFTRTDSEAALCDRMKDESAGWHAGQSVLTLQVNWWKALEETTVSFKTKNKTSKHSLAWYYWSRHAERLRPRLSKLV